MSLAVLLATYNGENYLEAQLESLFKQSFENFTVYAHDDGSTDKTAEILKAYEQKKPDRLKVLSYESTRGARDNFFSLLQRVEADYYMFCDQDDVWLRNKMEISLQELTALEKSAPDLPCMVFTDLRIADKGLNTVEESFMDSWGIQAEQVELNQLLVSNIAPGCTMIFNRCCRDRAVTIRDIRNFDMHDHLIILTAKLCGQVGYLNQRTILYRQHDDNAIGAYQREFSVWLKEKIQNIRRGEQLKSSYQIFEDQRKMVSELACMPGILPKYQKMMSELRSIPDSAKLKRMQIVHRYQLLGKKWKDRWKIILA